MISRHNRDTLLQDQKNENAFFALGHKKPTKVQEPRFSEEEGDDEIPNSLSNFHMKKGKKRNVRSETSQQQLDERKRQELDQILEDQKIKWEKKLLSTQLSMETSG